VGQHSVSLSSTIIFLFQVHLGILGTGRRCSTPFSEKNKSLLTPIEPFLSRVPNCVAQNEIKFRKKHTDRSIAEPIQSTTLTYMRLLNPTTHTPKRRIGQQATQPVQRTSFLEKRKGKCRDRWRDRQSDGQKPDRQNGEERKCPHGHKSRILFSLHVETEDRTSCPQIKRIKGRHG